jgi:hypothetical protein
MCTVLPQFSNMVDIAAMVAHYSDINDTENNDVICKICDCGCQQKRFCHELANQKHQQQERMWPRMYHGGPHYRIG